VNPQYPSVSKRANHRCEYCRAPEVLFNFRFEVEHIVPAVVGGETQGENLALSCRACNIYKAGLTQGTDPQTGEVVRLFHPRQDRWEDHFLADSDLCINGVTPIGRVTINLLRLNSEKQISSRRKWRRLKLFP
jgi:5-methylcytosine-specific restriction endonuclease McrA